MTKFIDGFDRKHPRLAHISRHGIKVKPDFTPLGGSFDGITIREGDLICYAEYSYPIGKEGQIEYRHDHRRLARVMCQAITGGDGKELEHPTFCCLAADDGMNFGYIRFVHGKDIVHASKERSSFAMWFTLGTFNAKETQKIWKIEKHGGLNNQHLGEYLDDEWELKYQRDMLAWGSYFLREKGLLAADALPVRLIQAQHEFEDYLVGMNFTPDWKVEVHVAHKESPKVCFKCGKEIQREVHALCRNGRIQNCWHAKCIRADLCMRLAPDMLHSFFGNTLVLKYEIERVEQHAKHIGRIVKCNQS